MEMHHGKGTRLYFSFLKAVFLHNVFLSILSVTTWIAHASQMSGVIYTASVVTGLNSSVWFYTNLVAVLSWWIFGPVFFGWVTFVYRPVYVLPPLHQDDTIRSNNSQDNRYAFSVAATCTGILLSAALFCCILQIQVAITKSTDTNVGQWMQLVLSASFVFCNFAWDRISLLLTQREHNKTWSRFRASHATKIVTYKVICATLMYLLISVFLYWSSTFQGQDEQLESKGINFITTLLIDIFVVTLFVQTILPWLIRALKIYFCGADLNDPLLRPEFDIAESLLTALFRQFIVYLATFVIPLGPLLGLVGTAVQFYADKIKVMRLCRELHFVDAPLDKNILVFTGVIAAAATCTFPSGGIFYLAFSRTL